MANPYHDETGRFCSKGEMGEAVERVYQTMVSTPSGSAQEEAANEWFNLRNEFEATKKQELDKQRPDNLKLRQKDPQRKANSGLLAEAQTTLTDRTADSFKRYTLPRGAMGFGSQDERYAQVVSTIAIQVLIEKSQESPTVTSTASVRQVKSILTQALRTFSAEESQDTLQLSLARTQEILDKHTRTHTLANGIIQDRIDAIPAIGDLERKALTVDIEDPKGKNEDLGTPAKSPAYKHWSDRARDSFEERAADLNHYELPRAMSAYTTLAYSPSQIHAQEVTRDAVDSVLSELDADYAIADYRAVSKRLSSHFEVLRKTDNATGVSFDRVEAILKRESSFQELPDGRRGVYVDARAAIRALEDKAFNDDLSSPVPAKDSADRKSTDVSAQNLAEIRARRDARRGAAAPLH